MSHPDHPDAPAAWPPQRWPPPPSWPSPASPPSDRSSTTRRSSRSRPPTSSRCYRQHQGAVIGWFLVLMISAALLAPVGILLGRLAGGSLGPVDRRPRHRRRHRPGHRPVPLGPAGPRHQRRRHRPRPHRRRPATPSSCSHTWLGTILGETIGYALTAAFTVARRHCAVTRAVAARWMAYLGYARRRPDRHRRRSSRSGSEAASLTNFVGYVAWCLWLIAMAVYLWRAPRTIPGHPAAEGTGRRPAPAP